MVLTFLEWSQKPEVCLNFGMLLHAPPRPLPPSPSPPFGYTILLVVRYDYLRYDMKDALSARMGDSRFKAALYSMLDF